MADVIRRYSNGSPMTVRETVTRCPEHGEVARYGRDRCFVCRRPTETRTVTRHVPPSC